MTQAKTAKITADELRAKIAAQLDLISASSSKSKEDYRALHSAAVRQELLARQRWINNAFPKYSKYFANGADIRPSMIQPILFEVEDDSQAELFRLARLTWSLPFTKGYGRRLRFLIMDGSNEKIMGIIGCQSPPIDFPLRDKLFDYPKDRKVELVNQTMDIYTLGALPPYNTLLAGKLVALAVASNEVRHRYSRRYSNRTTEISNRVLPAELVAMTTTSAFGRSSLYNRLSFDNRKIAVSIGYTSGYGSFHLLPVYKLVRQFLEQEGVSTRGGFGVGPRIVWQTYERAFKALGLPGELLKHGIRREAFLFPLVSNLQQYMNGQASSPIYYDQPFQAMARWWQERWLLPRSYRVDGWHRWNKTEVLNMLSVRVNETGQANGQ